MFKHLALGLEVINLFLLNVLWKIVERVERTYGITHFSPSDHLINLVSGEMRLEPWT